MHPLAVDPETHIEALLAWGANAECRYGFAYLSSAGTPLPDEGVQLWITCRMTHCFALGAKRGGPRSARYRKLAEHGITSLAGAFYDERYGGYYAELDYHSGAPRRAGMKEGYGHAFVLLAAASGVAADIPGARQLLRDAMRTSREHWFDGAWVHENFTRDFSQSEAYRGVNAAMHTVEADLAVAAVTGDHAWLDDAFTLTNAVVGELAPEFSWRIPEHLDERGGVQRDFNRENPADPFRPYGATPGHWWEWARLTWHLLAQSGERIDLAARRTLAANARELCAAAWREAWNVDGAPGAVYTVDFAGRPIVHARMHWVACEAFAAVSAGAAWDRDYQRALTGEPVSSPLPWQVWAAEIAEYCQRYLIVRPGVWHHELDRHNEPAATTWVGRPDIYHALQALLLPSVPLAKPLAVGVG